MSFARFVRVAGRFLGTAFSWTGVLVVAAWGVGGILLAIRYSSREPRTG
jgi:hypothetical protein